MMTPGDMVHGSMEERVQLLEMSLGRLSAVESKLDRVLNENDSFRKEIFQLSRENHELLKQRVEVEKENQQLKNQCEDMKVRMTELENNLKSSEADTRKECIQVIDAKMFHRNCRPFHLQERVSENCPHVLDCIDIEVAIDIFPHSGR